MPREPTSERDAFMSGSGARLGRPRPVGLLLEIGVIIFSVMVALLANEWRQGAARATTVRTVSDMVAVEVTANRAEVQRALNHHQDLLSQLQSGGIELRRLGLRDAPLDTTSEAAFARSFFEIGRAMGAPFREPPRVGRLPDGRWEVISPEGELWVTITGDTAILRGFGNISLRPAFLLDSAWETAQVTQAAVYMDPEIVEAMARVRQLHRGMERTVNHLVEILYGTVSSTSPLSALQDLVMYQTHALDAYDRLLGLLPNREP